MLVNSKPARCYAQRFRQNRAPTERVSGYNLSLPSFFTTTGINNHGIRSEIASLKRAEPSEVGKSTSIDFAIKEAK